MDSLLLDFVEVARLIAFSPATVANWAYRRKSAPQGFPPPVKVGRILRYRRIDIEGWIEKLGTPGPSTHVVSNDECTRRRGKPTKQETASASAMGVSVPAWRALKDSLRKDQGEL